MADDSSTSTGFGHGKVILLGEHSVVYGQPALAAGMMAGVRAHVSPGKGTLNAPAWALEVEIGDTSLPGQALARLLEQLDTDGRELDIWLEAEVPARAGLGSSAAMSIAVARAVAARKGQSEAQVVAAAQAAESVFHGTPSGIDTAAASHGRLGSFDRTHGWRDLPIKSPFELCVGVTGIGHDTSALVAAVRRLCNQTPVTHRIVEIMGELARAGMSTLAEGDISALARLFNLAHGLLAGLGVSSPEIEDMVHTARAAGALGAKLTGAGGGGAVIAIAAERGPEVLRLWRAKGFYGFLTTIGHV